MPLPPRPVRLVGVGLVVLGVLVAGIGLYQGSSGPPCPDASQSPSSLPSSDDGCPDTGVTALLGGATIAIVGAGLAFVAALLEWRSRDAAP